MVESNVPKFLDLCVFQLAYRVVGTAEGQCRLHCPWNDAEILP